MKQRLFSIVLVLALLLSAAACGKKAEPSQEPQKDTTKFSGGVFADGTDAPSTSPVAESDLIRISIPEGYTLLRLSWALEDKGICDSDAFVEASQHYDLSKSPLLSDLKAAENVCFRLEGYLFPATYEFKKNTDPVVVLDKLVSTMAMRLTDDMHARAKALGFSMHEILTMASIIEKEAFTEEQRTLISATIHNRLKIKMPMQYDVMTKYCTGVIQEYYPDKIDHYKHFYSGKRCKALPAGPICNPGMASIEAALYPADTEDLYFVIDTEPPYESRFAKTYEEHLKNCKDMGY